ncbi:MAG: rhomboid family intramembrane serine protease, partial [Solirubrobacterales bacterium]|nr:rhomboid family intramembrane serine protease [Solirubrobacterales bacterium]
MDVCYRHPSRETGVSCSSCGRPICPDCMTPTPVGMRCPECSRERTRVTRGVRSGPVLPRATQALIVINVIVFLAETATGAPLGGGGGGSIWNHGALFGPALTGNNPFPVYTGTHEYWRLLTSAFLHDGFLHIAINMFSLYFVDSALEPAIGSRNFVVVYMTSLLAGS